MKVRYCSIIAITLMLSLTSMHDAWAQIELPGGLFRKAPQTAKSLELTEGDGPWLIMCYSFSGEDGLQQAQRLATELRQTWRLKAYTYTHRFDLTEKIRGTAVANKKYVLDSNGKEVIGRDGRPILVEKNLTTASKSRIVETAVLVGNFASVEDERAQQLLAQIKKLTPKSLAGADPDALANDDDLAGGKLRFVRESVNRKHGFDGNSLRNAFMLPNPLLPEEYFTARSIDKFVIDLNKKVRRYSLLDNPGKYSVRVATFRGKTTINASKIQQEMDLFNWHKKNGKSMESELLECGNKANMLTKALRAQGVEAWEFHDREESYVCVGSFDWLKKTNASGVEVQNPEVREVILKYRGNVRNQGGHTYVQSVEVPKSLRNRRGEQDIAYDIQPLPVIVPKAPSPRRAKLFSKWR